MLESFPLRSRRLHRLRGRVSLSDVEVTGAINTLAYQMNALMKAWAQQLAQQML